MKFMIYCDRCHKEIKNDEWNDLISDKHLVPQHKKFCNFCKRNYDVLLSSDSTSKQHFTSEIHEKKTGEI